MTWNYRIVQETYENTLYDIYTVTYSLREVYYDKNGNTSGMTSDPATFSGDTPEEIVQALERALKDAKNRPVFVPPEDW